ncbi:MAG: Spy/CpxP family protein refolding chaperone [Azoarcus sp.]|jgi:preprotein translocase subunit Sss1|nr:Spy/CpxP family protein refolding chaperone [Azoarcus sp.]
MKSRIKTSLAVALLASTLLGGAVMAGHGGHGRAWGGAKAEQPVQERLGQHVEEGLARLELALVLTAEQKPAWAEFKQAIKAHTEQGLKQIGEHQAAGKPTTVVESLRIQETASRERAQGLADLRKIVETFYGKLGDAQKTVFDAESGSLLHHGRRAGRRS